MNPSDSWQREIKEAAYQRMVVDLLTMYRFRVFHTYDSRRSAPGFPDVIATDGQRLFVWEFKTERGQVSPDQEAWIVALRPFATDARVVRPSDWDELVAIITGRLPQ